METGTRAGAGQPLRRPPRRQVETPTHLISTPVPPTATSTPVPTREAPTTTTTLLITVAPIQADIPEVRTGRTGGTGRTHDGDCQDARQEALIAESLVDVTFETDRQCRVESGRWYGAFTGAYFERPRGPVDVDHMVPLKNAHTVGRGGDGTPGHERGVRQQPGRR